MVELTPPSENNSNNTTEFINGHLLDDYEYSLYMIRMDIINNRQ